MPRIKMIEANNALTLANLTLDNVEDYRSVPLTERGPSGTVVHLIGAFTSFNGEEFFALDNGHYVTLKGLRMHYQTPDDISGSSEYADAIFKAYLKEIKKRGYTIPKKDKLGYANPEGRDIVFTNAAGKEGEVFVKPKTSGVDVAVSTPGDPNAWKNKWKEYKSARLAKLGTPAEAAAFIINDHPLG